MLEISNLKFAYGNRFEMDVESMRITEGEIVGIIGPNGSGKSTLIKLMCGTLKPDAGAVKVDGRPLGSISPRQVAKKIAVVPQTNFIPFSFSALQVVLMGRTAHLPLFGFESHGDIEIAKGAMKETDCLEFASCPVNELSGGERQRVLIARALAQEAQILILDEPTTFLDLKHQIELHRLLKALNKDRGMTIVSAMHDLKLAAAFCNRVVMLKSGRVWADGEPGKVISAHTIESVFGVRVGVDGLYTSLIDC